MNDPLPLFVAPETLAQALDRADIQIVAVDSSADFTDAHIPGACQLAMADLMATAPPVGGLLPSDHALQDLFSSIGLRNDAQIVAYDRVGDGQAARLLWTLDAMGRDDIALLDGGLRAWHAAGLDLEAGAPASEPGDFQVQRRPERIADRQWIESHLNDDQVVTLDVRSAAEYAGSDVRSARGGHIPGAVNIDWEDLKNADGQLRPRAELVKIFADQDVNENQDIATYCQTHVRSSYVYLVLKYLGYPQIRGYPGAWSDWGNAADTPIVTGDAPGG